MWIIYSRNLIFSYVYCNMVQLSQHCFSWKVENYLRRTHLSISYYNNSLHKDTDCVKYQCNNLFLPTIAARILICNSINNVCRIYKVNYYIVYNNNYMALIDLSMSPPLPPSPGSCGAKVGFETRIFQEPNLLI